MSRGAGRLSILHDPSEDPQLMAAALAAHDPGAGLITVHPTVGTSAARMIAVDVLAALGCRVEDLRAHQLGSPERAFAAAAAWLAADGVEVLIVTRFHLLPEAARPQLARLATAAGLRIVAIWHGRRPKCTWPELFPLHPPNLIREIEDLGAVVGKTRHDSMDPESEHWSTQVIPETTRLPNTGLARFRAAAARTLSPTEFAAVDAHYRLGMQAAGDWLAENRLYRRLNAPGEPIPKPGPARGTATAGPGRVATPMGTDLPVPFGDAAGLQVFLSGLTADAATRTGTIARVRGAQAGMLVHGLYLQVPADLMAASGPGLSGATLSEPDIATIRAALPHPQHAAAVVAAAFTGLPGSALAGIPIAEPTIGRGNTISVTTGVGEAGTFRAYYAVPHTAAAVLHAARVFCRHLGVSDGSLVFDTDLTRLPALAQSAGIVLPHTVHRRAWHVASCLWRVGDPLHRPVSNTGPNDAAPNKRGRTSPGRKGAAV